MHVIMVTGKRRYLWLAAAAALLLAVAVLWQAGARRSPVSAAARQVPVYEVATERQAVAISFDASWGAEYTPLLLDTLDQYDVKTTFFLVNIWLEDYPEMAREIAAHGHEIGLHSVTHPKFTELSEAEMRRELTDNAALIEELTGYQPSLFRPPFGDYNNQVVEVANACGYHCIQWSIDSLDWKDLSADEIFRRVTKDIHAGDIVLFHNNGLHTAEALGPVLDYLANEGLAVVPVSELLLTGDCYVDNNGVQRRK